MVGTIGGKHSDAHKAAGVGDPFKAPLGPSVQRADQAAERHHGREGVAAPIRR